MLKTCNRTCSHVFFVAHVTFFVRDGRFRRKTCLWVGRFLFSPELRELLLHKTKPMRIHWNRSRSTTILFQSSLTIFDAEHTRQKLVSSSVLLYCCMLLYRKTRSKWPRKSFRTSLWFDLLRLVVETHEFFYLVNSHFGRHPYSYISRATRATTCLLL